MKKNKFKFQSFYPVSCGCCDNIKIFGNKTNTCRCNDYISPMPLWKRIIQVILNVHRENAESKGFTRYPNWNTEYKHKCSAWKVKILSKIISPVEGDVPWIWINSKSK